jgi:SAM-dependent methyltransferase
MGKAASATNKTRDQSFSKAYFGGEVLDIGAGSDPVVPHAQIFDRAEGDANKILNYLKLESFDCVHSSHCLEHMHDPKQALQEWWKLVKRGGYMITIVPHEDLYEQFVWPSIFNDDHKATFRITGAKSWSPVSINIHEECIGLSNCEVLSCNIQDNNYDYGLRFPKNQKPKNHRAFWNRQISSVARRIKNRELRLKFLKFQLSRGYPIDQTAKSDALAQIEIICQKLG